MEFNKQVFALETYIRQKKIIAIAAIIISIIAWISELSGLVYVCPYCRVQRTVIGILGIILLSPFAHHWIMRFISLVVGVFGVVVAVNQHFMGWKKISSGTFKFNDNILIDPFLLSGFALSGIITLLYLILYTNSESKP